MKSRLTVLDGGLMRMHRREERVLDRCRRLDYVAERMDVPEGWKSQYLIFPLDNPEWKMQFRLGQLECFVKHAESRRGRP